MEAFKLKETSARMLNHIDAAEEFLGEMNRDFVESPESNKEFNQINMFVD